LVTVISVGCVRHQFDPVSTLKVASVVEFYCWPEDGELESLSVTVVATLVAFP